MTVTRTNRRVKANPRIEQRDVYRFMDDVFDDELHKKRVLSISHGVLGVLHGAAAAVHAIGQGLAVARGLDPKHAVKQVDRLLNLPFAPSRETGVSMTLEALAVAQAPVRAA